MFHFRIVGSLAENILHHIVPGNPPLPSCEQGNHNISKTYVLKVGRRMLNTVDPGAIGWKQSDTYQSLNASKYSLSWAITNLFRRQAG